MSGAAAEALPKDAGIGGEAQPADVAEGDAEAMLPADLKDSEDAPEDEGLSITEEERPCFKVFDDWTLLKGREKQSAPGVWYFGITPGKGSAPPSLTAQWICTPLHVDAVTHDEHDQNFGRLLRFRNTNRRWRKWAMPMELLKGQGDELRGDLLSMGVEIALNGRFALERYLQEQHPARRVLCAVRVGWCGNGSFVLPETAIGVEGSGVVFQSGERFSDEYATGGTLEGWKTEVASFAVGNPLLLLAIASSFAGPLLGRCNQEGGGFHFVGDSSTGKTTAIEAACSVCGGKSYRRSWRATANGLEGVAMLFNDGLLALDEISECDPREVGAIVYGISNGVGKQRASRSGNARSVNKWRVFIISSGERTLGTTMGEAGHRTKAGQGARLLDIPVNGKHGAWDELHGLRSGTAFSDHLKGAAARHYGHPLRAYLEKLTRDKRDFPAKHEEFKALACFGASGEDGQEKRAAAKFALAALAGELATEYGITGWPEGEAVTACATMFNAWRAMRGTGNDERRQILQALSDFIDRHRDSRFSERDDDRSMIRERAGWWWDAPEGGRECLFHSAGMREALKGFDFKRSLKHLVEAGAIPAPDAKGEHARPVRINKSETKKVYRVNIEKLAVALGN